MKESLLIFVVSGVTTFLMITIHEAFKDHSRAKEINKMMDEIRACALRAATIVELMEEAYKEKTAVTLEKKDGKITLKNGSTITVLGGGHENK